MWHINLTFGVCGGGFQELHFLWASNFRWGTAGIRGDHVEMFVAYCPTQIIMMGLQNLHRMHAVLPQPGGKQSGAGFVEVGLHMSSFRDCWSLSVDVNVRASVSVRRPRGGEIAKA